MRNINPLLASSITIALSAAYLPGGARAQEMTGGDAVTPTAGSAIVTWSRPVENTDGSPLTNLAGYVLYYGTGFPVPFSTIFVDANATAMEIQNLSPGDCISRLSR